MWEVWANFINEQIEFELRNINKKSKIQLFEEDKTVRKYTISRFFSVKFGDRKMDKQNYIWKRLKNSFLKTQ